MSPVDLAVPVTMSQPRVKPIFFFFFLLCPEKNRMWLCHSCTIWKRQSCNGPANNVTCHHVYYSLVDWARSQGVSRNIRPPKIKKKHKDLNLYSPRNVHRYQRYVPAINISLLFYERTAEIEPTFLAVACEYCVTVTHFRW